MRQGGPVSSTFFTATNQESFRNDQLDEKESGIEGEKLSDLRFADTRNVALTTESIEDIKHQVRTVNEVS